MVRSELRIVGNSLGIPQCSDSDHCVCSLWFTLCVAQCPQRVFIVYVSYLEIYNDSISDLLTDSDLKLELRSDQVFLLLILIFFKLYMNTTIFSQLVLHNIVYIICNDNCGDFICKNLRLKMHFKT